MPTQTSASKKFHEAVAKLEATNERIQELEHNFEMIDVGAREEGLYATEKQVEDLSRKLAFFKERQKKQAQRCLNAHDELRRHGLEAGPTFDRKYIEQLVL